MYSNNTCQSVSKHCTLLH